MTLATDTVRVTEIFYSLQGEARTVGCPTVFVRLTGCPLRCNWCDTAYAFTGGRNWSVDEVLAEVASHAPRYVTVTGGEPLAQPACVPLLAALCDAGYEVSLETSGALPVDAVDPRVSRVMDLKAPGSGEAGASRGDGGVIQNRMMRITMMRSRVPSPIYMAYLPVAAGFRSLDRLFNAWRGPSQHRSSSNIGVTHRDGNVPATSGVAAPTSPLGLDG